MNVKAMLPPIYLALAMLGPVLGLPDSKIRGVTIEIRMATLPVAAGLGSSAALSVATAAAMLDVYLACQAEPSSAIDKDRGATDVGSELFDGGFHPTSAMRALINDWAFCAETLFHGNPSGLDNTVSTCVPGLSVIACF